MSTLTGETAVAKAVAEAIRAGGAGLSTEPRRVQALVADVLGAEARTRRAEVDAVVIAAEEGVADEILAGRLDADDALARLADRGLAPEVAHFAIAVWRYGLGLMAADAHPPTLTNSLRAAESVTDPATDELVIDITEHTTDAATVTTDAAAGPDAASSPSRRARRWSALGAAALVVVIALVAWTTVGGDDGPVDPKPRTVRLALGGEVTSLGKVDRVWEVRGTAFTSRVTVENPTEAAVSGRHYEVVPKALAADADLIASDPAHVVVEADPVIAWDLTLEPGAKRTFTSRLRVPSGVDRARLEAWAKERADETAKFRERQAVAPRLEMGTVDGVVVAGPDTDVVGTTDPGTSITVNGQEATVGEDGAWTARVSGLVPGPNTVTVEATSPLGATTSVAITVVVGPAPPGDADGDGVADPGDLCRDQPGPPANAGCPEVAVTVTDPETEKRPDPDTDGDGIKDSGDLCPTTRGTKANKGCPATLPPDPDTDGDGVRDSADQCDNQVGPASNGGCPVPQDPDSDGDTVRDSVDQCDNQVGPASNGGCPIPDGDGDGFADNADRCPSERGISAHGGCPAPTLTIYGRANVTASPGACEYSYTVGWTPSALSASSYQWSGGNGTAYTGGKTVSGLYFENPGTFTLRVTVVIDGISYSKSASITASQSVSQGPPTC